MENYNKRHEEVLDEIKTTFHKMEIRVKYFDEVNEQLERFKRDLMMNTNNILDEILSTQYKLSKLKYDNNKHEKLLTIISDKVENIDEYLGDTPKYLNKIKYDLPTDIDNFYF